MLQQLYFIEKLIAQYLIVIVYQIANNFNENDNGNKTFITAVQ